ncbi:ubiquitin carboxyl-terminal hydrolase CYLD [Hoplias malabaricus]|uniref:ubiquitin carboxyl-terminal hydrolase CYLD n=1 Tax=Hoplias malabaricus TaxID=27720 RepID=UPI00346341DF
MAPKYHYFIAIASPALNGFIRPGRICYITEDKYSQAIRLNKDTITMKIIGVFVEHYVPLEMLRPLSTKQAELLLGLDKDSERFDEFSLYDNLNQTVDLVKGSEVRVEHNGEWLKGVIRHIGRHITSREEPIGGVTFGIELQGEDKGKGTSDGGTIFNCPKNCGVFAPFNRIKPVHHKPLGFSTQHQAVWSESSTEEVSVGDRVIYFIGDTCRSGMVVELVKEKGTVLISTDSDDNGRQGGEITVSLKNVFKEEDSGKTEKIDTIESPDMAKFNAGGNAHMSLSSMVEVDLAQGPAYGTIRWIGYLPGKPDLMAGLELEEACAVSDGTFKDIRYFSCPQKRGLFVKLTSCRPDARFLGDTASNGHYHHNGLDISAALDSVPPIKYEDVLKILIGRNKGIQGHCNSCYMDAALFSLFSCSSVLDSLLYKGTHQKDEPIQKTLLRDIVGPLRSQGFVGGHNVMKLRKQLQDRGHSSSYTTDEKDPEEFLTLIMQNILSLEPPLKLQTFEGLKVESSYFYQIFVDYNNSLVLPTVQQLLEHSFYNNGLKLAEVPSCLILTMPRSGKQFKMYQKIIPSLELDITALLSDGPRQCVLCGQLAHVECTECFGDSAFSNTGFKNFCDTCSAQVHLHHSRQSHKPTPLCLPEGFLSFDGPPRTLPREKLQLFAVLCIETSHYVSFVKYGPQATDWIFFDSMADRVGERDGFNIPEVKECPEVVRYLSMPLAELATQAPREMEGVAKRLFCDGYMYLYQSPNMALYH